MSLTSHAVSGVGEAIDRWAGTPLLVPGIRRGSGCSSPPSNTVIGNSSPGPHRDRSTGLSAARRTAATRTRRLDRQATGDVPVLQDHEPTPVVHWRTDPAQRLRLPDVPPAAEAPDSRPALGGTTCGAWAPPSPPPWSRHQGTDVRARACPPAAPLRCECDEHNLDAALAATMSAALVNDGRKLTL